MPDPWTKIEANRSDQGSEGEGAKWVITTGVALALVIFSRSSRSRRAERDALFKSLIPREARAMKAVRTRRD